MDQNMMNRAENQVACMDLTPATPSVDPGLVTLKAAASGPTPHADAGHRVAFYIDADNQPASGLPTLIDLFGLEAIHSATIVGNNHGKQIEAWRQAFETHCGGAELTTRKVSATKQAADISLIFELGSHLEKHVRNHDRIVIVSRDELLISAGEQAKERGCHVSIAYCFSENPPPRQTALLTLLLPNANRHVRNETAPINKENASPNNGVTVSNDIQDELRTTLAQLKAACTQKPGGGYSATEVGQELSKLGFSTKSARMQFLKTVPGLKEHGTGPQKVLLF